MQVGAVLYQRIDAACVDLDFNCEKKRGAKKAKNGLAFFAPLCLFAFPLVCNE
jgi:hypothetical protein